jgi:hypothetical protein
VHPCSSAVSNKQEKASRPRPPPFAVALAAAKDAFSHRMQERGNTNAKFWVGGVLRALGGERHWHQVGLRQLRWARGAARHARFAAGGCSTSGQVCACFLPHLHPAGAVAWTQSAVGRPLASSSAL